MQERLKDGKKETTKEERQGEKMGVGAAGSQKHIVENVLGTVANDERRKACPARGGGGGGGGVDRGSRA